MKYTTSNTPTLHFVPNDFHGSPGPAMYKYEIPGFEGFKPANGKHTDTRAKRLTNQDALMVIIDTIMASKNGAAAHISEIRQLARMWKKPTTMVSAKSTNPDWVGWYFNSSYGYVGNSLSCNFTPNGSTLSKKSLYNTYWYRTSRGYYVLTFSGKRRANQLRLEAEANSGKSELTQSEKEKVEKLLKRARGIVDHQQKSVQIVTIVPPVRTVMVNMSFPMASSDYAILGIAQDARLRAKTILFNAPCQYKNVDVCTGKSPSAM